MGRLFLSVAGYVVKPKPQKFKRKEKCGEQKQIHRFQKKTADFVELLPRFELGTSSLPTDCQPSEYRFPVLWGPFCSGKSETAVLSAPLPPPARFLLWVKLWVRRIRLREIKFALHCTDHKIALQQDHSGEVDIESLPQQVAKPSRPSPKICTTVIKEDCKDFLDNF